jgi:hypothetical protein
MSIISTVLMASEVLMRVMPSVIKTVEDARPFAESLFAQLKGEELTDEERIELRARVDTLHAEMQSAQPPAEPGDPDYVEPDDEA